MIEQISYTKEDVLKSFLSINKKEIKKHQVDLIQAVRILIITSEKFTTDDIHKILVEKFGRSKTASYHGLINVMIENKYLHKIEDNYLVPSNIVRELVGV
jgi:hypothetical protein